MKKRKVQVVTYCTIHQHKTQVLLLQTNHRRGLFWQNVTGGVEPGETLLHAAKREVEEETGVLPENILSMTPTDLEFNFTDQWKHEVNESVFFLQVKSPFTPLLDPSEHINFSWHQLETLDETSVRFSSNWQSLQRLKSTLT